MAWMRAISPVVGELDLAVLQPAGLSNSAADLRFLFSVLLVSSCLLWCPCALRVPSACGAPGSDSMGRQPESRITAFGFQENVRVRASPPRGA